MRLHEQLSLVKVLPAYLRAPDLPIHFGKGSKVADPWAGRTMRVLGWVAEGVMLRPDPMLEDDPNTVTLPENRLVPA